MNGTVTGGWGYVFAAYVITFSAVAVYGMWLWYRLSGEGRTK